MNKKSVLVSLSIITIVAFFVYSSMATNRFMNHLPEESELLGEYQCTHKSLQELALKGLTLYKQPSEHRLMLKPGGLCAFRSYKIYISNPPGGEENCYIDYEGEWIATMTHSLAVVRRKPVACVELTVRKNSSSFSRRLYIRKKDDDIVLWTYVGDPDYSNFFEFTKKPQTSLKR
jgi:hypothetical protein